MNKILTIIRREYVTRVRSKVFIILTILAPVLLASIFVVPMWLARNGAEEEKIGVLDKSGIFSGRLEDKENVRFTFFGSDLIYDSLKNHYEESDVDGILYIPDTFSLDHPVNVEYYSSKQLGLVTSGNITDQMNSVLRIKRLEKANITQSMLEQIDTPVRIIETQQRLGSAGTSAVMGYFMGFMIYIVMLIYGSMVMRGVLEEKTSRIAEVIVSSVKPFQLMMGKIIGIAMVGLTQFVVWIALTGIIMTIMNNLYADQIQQVQQYSSMQNIQGLSQQDIPDEAYMLADFQKLPLGWIALGFIFFFIAGYLLYASLFAALGAASGDEGDQSLAFIATLPVIISIIIMISVITQPHSKLAVITSMIPLCSPIIMAARLPFVPPLWEVLLSGALLIAGFLLMVWIAGKIYRTGILMYGKKGSLKEIVKWVRY